MKNSRTKENECQEGNPKVRRKKEDEKVHKRDNLKSMVD